MRAQAKSGTSSVVLSGPKKSFSFLASLLKVYEFLSTYETTLKPIILFAFHTDSFDPSADPFRKNVFKALCESKV